MLTPKICSSGGGTQKGSSAPVTPWASRNASSTQRSVASAPAASRSPDIHAPQASGAPGPVALNTPGVSCSRSATMKAPRSRASMNWTGRSAVPGTSTSPPWRTRTAHQV